MCITVKFKTSSTQIMGQFFSWVKSNERQILVTLDNLAKKGVESL